MLSFNSRVRVLISLIIIMCSVCAKAEVIRFINVNIITMERERVLYQHQIFIDDEKIIAIEPMTNKSKVISDRIIDGDGMFVIPGFVDTHFHQVATDEKKFEPLNKLLLANGVTAVVNMAEYDGQDAISMRANANKKETLAPYYLTAGPFLDADNVRSAAEAVEMVRHHKTRGYDFIKIHGDLSEEVYLVLLDEAEKVGIPVIGHGQRSLPLEYTLRLNHVAHIEEFVMNGWDQKTFTVRDINDQQAKEIARQVKYSGVYVSPTLSILSMVQDYTIDDSFEKLKNRELTKFIPKETYNLYTTPGKEYRSEFFLSQKVKTLMDNVVKNTKKLTKAFSDESVPFLVGSDSFGMHVAGFSFHDEMEMMNQVGVPTYEILNAATIRSARYLRRQASSGSISVGKRAEFVLLSKNPLEDIKNTREIQGVMLKGRWLNRKDLDKLLIDVELFYKSE
jgi:imidazolonepropionase-like amidohydrolase